MSTFGTLDIARRGLIAAQKAIDVTGHNIANANTPGYTRQRLELQNIEAKVAYGRFSQVTRGISGRGVEVVTVDQIRNPFLDRQFRRENSLMNEWSTKSQGLSYVEALFDELSDTGLSKAMNDFVSSLQEVSKNPVNREYRTNMMQNAIKMTETINHYANQLLDMQKEQDSAISITVGRVNDIVVSISDLNSQIERYEMSGQKANDLKDKRNLLLDQLSGLVAINVTENSKGHVKINLSGEAPVTLLEHVSVNKLVLSKDVENPITGQANDLFSVRLENQPEQINFSGGNLKAYFDLRDGNTNTEIGLPYFNSQLNRFVDAIATEFNAVHESNWTMMDSGSGLASITGISFFTDENGNTNALNSLNIKINPTIINNSYNIALSSTEILNDYDKNNNAGAIELINLFNKSDIPDVGGYYTFVESFIGEIAVEASHSETRLQGQQHLLNSIDIQRQSVSSVSLDEEMTNLIKYQHSYTASARMITVIDEMIDLLVNRTGIAGR